MGRAKLRMELVPKEKTRITTYHKRKLGIFKKAKDFSVLCDVNTVIIIKPPNSNEPEVWPENPDKIKKAIASYKSIKGETRKRTYNLKDFFQDRRKKIEDELMKARKKTMEAKYSPWFDSLNILPEDHLRELVAKLEEKERVARTRLDQLKKRNTNIIYPYMPNYGNMPSMHHFPGLGKPDPELDHRHMLMNREPMAAVYAYPLLDYGVNDNNLKNPYLSFLQQQPLVQGGNNPYLSFDQQQPLVQSGNNPYLSFHQQQPWVQGGMLSQFEPQQHDFRVSNGCAGDVIDYRS